MANVFPTSLNNYTGSETLSAAGHAQAHDAYEAKIGTGASTPTNNTVLRGNGTGTSVWAQVALTTDVTGTLPVLNGGTGVTTSTGSGANVLGTSPTIVTPTIASLANATHTHQNAAGGGTLDAAAIAAGTVATARLGSGSATSSSYLRGDQTWAALSITTDGWTADANTWTYSSVDGPTGVVTINADLTGIIQAGDRIKFTQTTVKYFIVTKTPTFGAGSTTLTFYGGTDYALVNAAITLPSYSHAKIPFGFPTDPRKWTVEVTDTTREDVTTPTTGTWYNPNAADKITVPIGLWNLEYEASIFCSTTASTFLYGRVTLSTANNSESDADMTAISAGVNGASNSFGTYATVYRRKVLSLTTKTDYFLNIQANGNGTLVLSLYADLGKLFLRAICAYL